MSIASSHTVHLFLLVLESRIHQLQSDVVLDVRRAKGQFVRNVPSEKRAVSAKGPKIIPREKSDIPKSGKTASKGASKSKPSRWMQKLSEERQKTLRTQQDVQKVIKKETTKKPSETSEGSKSSMMPSAAAHGTKLTTGKESVPPERTSRQLVGDESNLNDLYLSIRFYLEACVFSGAVDKAYRFLMSHHRSKSRRKNLDTHIYNILMRVWAKTVSGARVSCW